MRYTLSLLSALATIGVAVCAGEEAIFFSGGLGACNKTEWSEEEKEMSSGPRDMDARKPCVSGQTGRRYVWVPKLDQDYCLVQSDRDGCPGEKGYMEGLTLELAADRKSAESS